MGEVYTKTNFNPVIKNIVKFSAFDQSNNNKRK
jgi:hypothetical protein